MSRKKKTRARKNADNLGLDLKPWPHPDEIEDQPITYKVLKHARNESLREIANSRSEMRAGFKQIDARLDDIEGRFSKIDARFNKIDERFSKIDARFNKIDARFSEIDARFNKIDARFSEIDARFNKIDERFSKIDARFDRLEAQVHELTAAVHKVLATVERMQSDQAHFIQQVNVSIDAYRTIYDKMENDRRAISQDTDHRLDMMADVLKQVAKKNKVPADHLR